MQRECFENLPKKKEKKKKCSLLLLTVIVNGIQTRDNASGETLLSHTDRTLFTDIQSCLKRNRSRYPRKQLGGELCP